MTGEQIISNVDSLMPNQYSTEQKVSWLSSLDGKIFNEVILTHSGARFVFFPFDGYDSDECELIVQPPYAADLYGNYLKSRICAENGEIAKYNQYVALYTNAYNEWAAWYNKTHMPRPGGKWVL